MLGQGAVFIELFCWGGLTYYMTWFRIDKMLLQSFALPNPWSKKELGIFKKGKGKLNSQI